MITLESLSCEEGDNIVPVKTVHNQFPRLSSSPFFRFADARIAHHNSRFVPSPFFIKTKTPYYQAVLNSDSEHVLSKGLRHFASQIRREHGLRSTDDGRNKAPSSSPSQSTSDDKNTKRDVDNDDASDGVSDSCSVSSDGNRVENAMEIGRNEMEQEEEEEEEGAKKEWRTQGSESSPPQQERVSINSEAMALRYRKALVVARAVGEAPGLLGEYLRGSPQLNDLLAVWDLEIRKSSPPLAAAHIDSLAAVLECLYVVLRVPLMAAAEKNTVDMAQNSPVKRTTGKVGGGGGGGGGGEKDGGGAVEATGLALCRYGIDSVLR